MPDNNATSFQDLKTIDPLSDEQVEYISEELKVTKEEILKTINEVGEKKEDIVNAIRSRQ
jgi:hypothetical protein